MALKITVTTPHGITVNNAYHRVEYMHIVGKTEIKFQMRSYASPDFPHFSDVEYSCAYDIGGKNPIAQAYAHLKTLPEFSDAVDC